LKDLTSLIQTRDFSIVACIYMLINNYLTIAFILNDKALFFLNLKNKRSQNLIQKLIQIKKKKKEL